MGILGAVNIAKGAVAHLLEELVPVELGVTRELGPRLLLLGHKLGDVIITLVLGVLLRGGRHVRLGRGLRRRGGGLGGLGSRGRGGDIGGFLIVLGGTGLLAYVELAHEHAAQRGG